MSKRIFKRRKYKTTDSRGPKLEEGTWYSATWNCKPLTIEDMKKSFDNLRKLLDSQRMPLDPKLIISREMWDLIKDDPVLNATTDTATQPILVPTSIDITGI
jgi:hypothetical protein